MNESASLNELAPERRLRRLELTVTRRLDGLLHGSHLGLLPGPGSEPAGSREYRAGEDEVRRMDWAVTARTTVPHVRTVDADRELSTWVLVDASASMDFGTAEYEKRELAVAAVAAVGFLTTGTGNRLGAHLLTADGVERRPARSGRTAILEILRSLLNAPRAAPATATTGLAAAVDGLHRAVPRRGLMVIVSDFLDGLDADGLGPAAPDWELPLRRLATRHQVLAVQVGDPREQELPEVGLLALIDPETGRRREIDTTSKRLRLRYAEAARQQQQTVTSAIRRSGAAHLMLRTDRDWVADIVRHVHAQRRLRGATS
ncbi:DUF58 domain-containing protein [Actinoplanes couchii]|uniref:DUF58 domain-containing protein n=1 Tax=Actinoplanes couchii TaxID=403638 RepID=A0ABQ3XSQ4_9ACTN|nr:DUF58 domain-containing protein [Actinoplanes couchii]MDR6318526.1 uncharacterized protein (DUF58 family) [Actinoplanes couchii]GID61542.1 hypothetical protein Aco03nite_099460 [Actinoplanes couchii]